MSHVNNTTAKPRKRFKMKSAIFAFAAIAVLGASAASAASLGVATTNSLGAGTSVTAACQPSGVSADIAIAFATPTYSAASGKYDVSGVNLSGIAAACNGKAYQLTLADSTGTSLGSATGTVTGTTATVTVPGTIDASAVTSVALVIY